jgi:autotransporter-associated beta strand protein
MKSYLVLLSTFLLILTTNAQNLTISSTGQTGTSGSNWSIASNVLTITGNADVNASVISNHLASNNLSLSGVVNAYVNSAISWSSNSILTLNASQNILIYSDITASGSSPQLYVYYGGSNASTAPNNSFIYALSQRNRNKINFSSSSAVFRVGNESYTVCTNLSELSQALSNATSSTRVALGASISLSQTYTNSLFPINFSGKFDGLGQVIDGLRIRNSGGTSVKANLGLFSQLQGATIRNIGITNIDILINSTSAGTTGSEFRIGALAGNIGNSSLTTSGYSSSAYTTTIESVWSSGNIGTANDFTSDNQSSGDRQKFFFAGGLVGSINNGTANISRCYSYCNVSSSGSYTDNLSAGGLIGDVGINLNLTGHTTSTNSSILFNLSKSFSTGSILTGGQGLYYGTGGLIGVVFVSGSTIENCYSWSSAVAFAGGGSMGGILGFGIDGGTYRNMYSTQSNQGDIRTTNSNLYYSQSPSSGTTLPSGFSSSVWSKANGALPILLDLETPPNILYVRVTSAQSSTCGNISINYNITDGSGNTVTLSTLGLSNPSGTPIFTINNLTPPGTYSGVSYLSGLTLTGTNANNYTLNPFPSNASTHTITGTCSNYQITFNGNSNTSGTAPANITFTGSTTIPNQGSLVKTSNTFLGWNTAANGSGTTYAAGSTYSGTSNLTLYAQWVTVSSLGCITIVASGGAAENSGWVASYNTIRSSSSSAVNINASDIVSKLGSGNVKIMGNCITISSAISYTTNTKELTLESNTTIIQNDAITLSGPVSMIGGGNITINGNINTSTGNASGDISVKSAGDVSISSSRTITTNGGDVILWSNTDGNATSTATDGSIVLNHSSSISTTGGHLWMGGGSSNASWNGLTVGNGYAIAGSTINVGVGSSFTSGVCIMRSTINTNGGDIFIGGQNNKSGFTAPLVNYGTTTIDAGAGKIKLEGRSSVAATSTFATGMHSGLGGISSANLTIKSSHNTSSNNAIEIDVTNITNVATVVEGNTLIQSTGAGKVSFTATSTGTGKGIELGFTGTNSPGYLDILSATGDITLNTGASGFDITSTSLSSTLGFKAGSSVTSSTANIRIISNIINTVGILNNNTNGTLRIEPVTGSSFSSALNTTQIRYSSGITGLIIGHSTNTSNLTIGSATSINGPIEVYGGTISLSGNLTTTNTTTGDIIVSCNSISGNGNISIANGKTATLSIANSAVYNGIISGTGSNFIKQGTGNLTLTGANSYTGTTTMSAGNIQIGNGGTTGTIGTGNITNNTSLIYNRTNDYTIPGVISGTGSLTKDGTGTLTLTNINTHTGTNTINSGTLVLNNNTPSYTNKAFVGTGQLRIEPQSGSFAYGIATTGWSFASTLTGLTLGKSSNSVTMTIDNATTINGPITVFGGLVSINSNISSTASTGTSISINGTRINQNTNINVTTSGSHINYTVANAPFTSGADDGIVIGQGAQINAGGGNISLTASYASTGTAGTTSGTYDHTIRFNQDSRVITTGTGTITITGDATNNTSTNSEVWSINLLANNCRIQTASGAITIDGTGGKSSSNSRGIVSDGYSALILSASGPITLIDRKPIGFTGTTYGGFYLRPNSTSNFIIGADGTNVTSSSSAITIQSDRFYVDNTSVRRIEFKTSGPFVLEPLSSSFENVNLTGFTLAGNPSSVLIGKSTSTANISTTSAISAAGPITIYGGTLTLNENLNSSTGSNISLYGNGLSFATGKTVTSSGQLIVAPQTASNSIGLGGATGTLSLPASYFSTNFADGFSNIQIGSNTQTGAISSNAFTLRDNMSFLTSGSLTLGGIPVLGSNNLTLGSSISSISASASAYFQTNGTGVVNRTIANNVNHLFPIGNAAYNPVSIANNTGASDVFTAKVRDAVLEDGTSGITMRAQHVGVTWDINKTNPNASSGVDFTLQWNSSQEANSINSFRLNHYNSSTPEWEFATGTSGSVSGSTTKTMTHTGYTGTFSPFAIGSNVTPLPVDLISFHATPNNNSVDLTWTTFGDNRNPFNILKSTDGVNWESIGTQIPSENSVHYLFTDNKPEPINYYQLSQLDNSNTLQYSDIRIVNFNSNKLVIFPNPNNGEFTIKSSNTVNFQIIDYTGKVIMESDNSNPLIKTNLTKGIYFIKIIEDEKTTFSKMIVQ